MQQLKLLVLVLIMCMFITACDEETDVASSKVPDDQIAATVNGTVISKSDVSHFRKLKGNPQVDDAKLIEVN